MIVVGLPAQLMAQSYQQQISLQFPVENRGAPTSTTGAGTRGASCTEEGNIPLTALMPTRKNAGTTVSPNPTFFWYVPKTAAQSAEFVVVDDRGNAVYRTNLDLSHTPGVVKVSLPVTASLETGKNYMWGFALICDPVDRTQDKFVQGAISRIEMTSVLKSKLQQAKPLDQAKLYADAKIWYDTLTKVAQLRSSRPTEWEELLKSVGLENIAPEPFVSIEKLKP
ncbi:MAG: DUF928 domain-containing protein [Chamaesiphon sp.]